MNRDEEWMQVALDAARMAFGACHPNPAVGAIVVHDGQLVGKGYTQAPGSSHAEVVALEAWRSAGAPLNDDTTLYVTLEPCCTHGRTPPCTGAVLASGIRRVVGAATDPNPEHGGRGVDVLRAAGIDVQVGVLGEEAADLNLVFNFWIQNGRPFIAAKMATTLDGFTATRAGHSKWITGEDARRDVARWRRAFPTIGVGAGTVIADDPRLTSRLEGVDDWCPVRLVFDRRGLCLGTPKKQVFSDQWASKTIYLTSEEHTSAASSLWAEKGVEIHSIDSLSAVIDFLKERGLSGLYLEGGRGLWGDWFKSKHVDYLFSYQAPLVLGDGEGIKGIASLQPLKMSDALHLTGQRRERFGADLLTRGFIQYPQ